MSIYLKSDVIKGNVTVNQFKDAIEVFDVEFGGINRGVRMSVGDTMDRFAGSLSLGQVSFTKAQDNATVDLFQAAHKGTVFNKLEFNYVSEGSNPTTYGKTILHNAVITSFTEKHNHQTHRPFERIRIAYTKIERNIIPIDSTERTGSQKAAGYDVEQAQAM
jgi:type VI secretion system Hcp family effector